MDNNENNLPPEPTNNNSQLPPNPRFFEEGEKQNSPKLTKLMISGLILTLIGLVSSIILFIVFILFAGLPLFLLFFFLAALLVGIGFTIASFFPKINKKLVWVYIAGIFGMVLGLVLGFIGGIILISAAYSYGQEPKY